MRSRFRRRLIEAEEMNITAFMNLMVILVPFLLITAVFSKITIHELNLPAAASGAAETKRELQLEITIRADAIEVGDRRTGLIKALPMTDKGHDFAGLSRVLWQVKEQFPSKSNATILSMPDTSYDLLIKTMDAVRVYSVATGGSVTRQELFPEISIGDAPTRAAPAKAAAPQKSGVRAK